MNNNGTNSNNTISDLQHLGNTSHYHRNNYRNELNTLFDMYYDMQAMLESDSEEEDDTYDEMQVIHESFHQACPYKKVFDIEKNQNLLKHTCYNKDVYINTSCPIYMVEFDDDTEVVELPCGHCFIPEAIYEWLEKQSHCCPFCRYELPSKEIKIDAVEHTHPTEIYPDRPANAFDVANIQNNEILLEMISEIINGNNF